MFHLRFAKKALVNATKRVALFTVSSQSAEQRHRVVLLRPDTTADVVHLVAENQGSAAHVSTQTGAVEILGSEPIVVAANSLLVAFDAMPDEGMLECVKEDGSTQVVIRSCDGQPEIVLPAQSAGPDANPDTPIPSVRESIGEGICMRTADLVHAHHAAARVASMAFNGTLQEVLAETFDGKEHRLLRLGAMSETGATVWRTVPVVGDTDILTLLPMAPTSGSMNFSAILSRLSETAVLRIQYDDVDGRENTKVLHLRGYVGEAADDIDSVDVDSLEEDIHIRMAVSASDPAMHRLTNEKIMDTLKGFVTSLTDGDSFVVDRHQFFESMDHAAAVAGLNTISNEKANVLLDEGEHGLLIETEGDSSFTDDIPFLIEPEAMDHMAVAWSVMRPLMDTCPDEQGRIRLNIVRKPARDPKAPSVARAILLFTEEDWKQRMEHPLPDDYIAIIPLTVM